MSWTPKVLPDNPTAKGWSASKIKLYQYKGYEILFNYLNSIDKDTYEILVDFERRIAEVEDPIEIKAKIEKNKEDIEALNIGILQHKTWLELHDEEIDNLQKEPHVYDQDDERAKEGDYLLIQKEQAQQIDTVPDCGVCSYAPIEQPELKIVSIQGQEEGIKYQDEEAVEEDALLSYGSIEDNSKEEIIDGKLSTQAIEE